MAASILIDDFTTGDQTVEDLPDNFPNASNVPAGDAIGGNRDMSVLTSNQFNPEGPGDTSLSVDTTEIAPSPASGMIQGVLSFDNVGGSLGNGLIVYDGNGTQGDLDIDGLGGVDFTMGGDLDRFFFDVVRADNVFDITVRVYGDTASGSGVSTFVENIDPDAPGGFDPFLRFTEFDTGADLTNFENVGALSFEITSVDPAVDGALASISVVPLPASALLLLGGLGGFAGLSAANRRRRRKEA